jgi:hypothetical protein
MAYSKPERKSHKKTKKKKPVGKTNPTVKLRDASWRWADERSKERESKEIMDSYSRDAKTHNMLERRGLKINKSNWLRYHGSKKS